MTYVVKTKEPIIYDIRDYKIGIVNIKMNYTLTLDGYNVTTTDYVEHIWQPIDPQTNLPAVDENNQPILATRQEVLKTKNFTFSYAQLNGLLAMIPNVPTGITREDEDERHRLVLLYYIQTDWRTDEDNVPQVGTTIYGLTPQDWEIRR